MSGHQPTWLPADLPDGYAECLICRNWITAAGLLTEACPGPVAADDIQIPAPVPDPVRDAERKREIAMLERCARHQ